MQKFIFFSVICYLLDSEKLSDQTHFVLFSENLYFETGPLYFRHSKNFSIKACYIREEETVPIADL